MQARRLANARPNVKFAALGYAGRHYDYAEPRRGRLAEKRVSNGDFASVEDAVLYRYEPARRSRVVLPIMRGRRKSTAATLSSR
jgi:hypothetical protein